MTKHTVSIKGINIAYHSSSDTGFPVLLVHGNSSSLLSFTPQLQHTNYRFIAIDLPGHGASEKSNNPENDYTVQGLGLYIIALVEHLALAKYVVVGHSLGGHIITEALPKLKGAIGILIFGTPPLKIPIDMDKMFNFSPVLQLAFMGVLTNEQTKELANYYTNNNIPLIDGIAQAIHTTDPKCREDLGKSIGELRGITDEVNILQKLKYPLAILQGNEDRIVRLEYLELLELPTLHNSKIKLISNASHFPQLENPDEFNKYLFVFLNYCTVVNN